MSSAVAKTSSLALITNGGGIWWQFHGLVEYWFPLALHILALYCSACSSFCDLLRIYAVYKWQQSCCYFVNMISVVDGANLIYIQDYRLWLASDCGAVIFHILHSYSFKITWWLLFIYHMHVYCTAWNKIHCDRQKHDSLLSSLSCCLLICIEFCHVVIVTRTHS